jgi:hypothetical protein
MDMEFDFSKFADVVRQAETAVSAGEQVMIQAEMEKEVRTAEARRAAVETAENTAEMKSDLKEVIHNQNDYIKLLKHQNKILKNIFVSGEDGVAVQKEIMQILQQQGSESIFADKGLDVGVNAVLLAVQLWLKSRGFDF